jgi:hypothetical protein
MYNSAFLVREKKRDSVNQILRTNVALTEISNIVTTDLLDCIYSLSFALLLSRCSSPNTPCFFIVKHARFADVFVCCLLGVGCYLEIS